MMHICDRKLGRGLDNGLWHGARFTSMDYLLPLHGLLSKVWDEITYLFPNFNGATVEVWEEINNSIAHFIVDVIT